MSRTIHINLLKNSERRSHMPIRTLVMVPAIASLLLLCLIVWAIFLSSKNASLVSGRDDILLKKEGFKAAETDYKETKKLEAIAKSELGQLESYQGSRIVFADMLERFPHIVPATMQLTSLDILPRRMKRRLLETKKPPLRNSPPRKRAPLARKSSSSLLGWLTRRPPLTP